MALLPRVLLIEDDRDYARLVEHLLRRHYSLTKAFTLEEACVVLDVAPSFVAIVLDLNLPDARGIRTLQQLLRVMEDKVSSPVLVLSGLDEAEGAVVEAGIMFLSKQRVNESPAVLVSTLARVITGDGI